MHHNFGWHPSQQLQIEGKPQRRRTGRPTLGHAGLLFISAAVFHPRSALAQESAVPAQPTPSTTTVGTRSSLNFQDYLQHKDAVTEGVKLDTSSSPYIPVDSWVYPELMRLYSLGYLNRMFLGMRPLTRRSLVHILDEAKPAIVNSSDEQAQQILARLLTEVSAEVPANAQERSLLQIESTYTRLMGIGGTPLRDSYHLGQTIVNDYGRPYESGFNVVSGASAYSEWKRFSLYVRGEYQHAPDAAGYSAALANQLAAIDSIYAYHPIPPNTPQATIPAGPIAEQNPFRLVEASLSFHVLGNEISGGKTDAWLGPGRGGALGWSNNAENIYSFRVNRVEPLFIPWVSSILGPVRYDFFYGSLKGHTDPEGPWVHSTMLSFRPTVNVEFGFQRTVIFGGKGHEPVTIHNFLRSFFSVEDANSAQKDSATDPGARFSDFNFSWRLPYARKYATLYLDSIAHDDVTPPSAPRRAAYRPGVEIAQIPGIRRLEVRVEGISTDPPVTRSMLGQFNYYELIQVQGYTNKGFILGDWIGREAKGGQAWFTYHLSGNEWIQAAYLNKKTPKDFIPGGTTQNSVTLSVVKRLGPDLLLDAALQIERWKAPIYLPGANNNSTATIQLTYYPHTPLHLSRP